MSIAALSSSFVSAMRERAAPVPALAGAAAEQASPLREGGRRHALVDAMKLALGSVATSERGDDQAIFRFAHALMHDLRRLEGSDDSEGPGRGKAWGRRDWSDLPQRIDALATASAAPAPATQKTAEPEVAVPPTTPAVPSVPQADRVALAAASTLPALPDLPPQPNPVTTTSAAVHLMQVPSSRLLEAYAALHQALGDGATPTSASDTRTALSEFLTRLTQSLAADTTAALPAGSVVNLRA